MRVHEAIFPFVPITERQTHRERGTLKKKERHEKSMNGNFSVVPVGIQNGTSNLRFRHEMALTQKRCPGKNTQRFLYIYDQFIMNEVFWNFLEIIA